MQTSVNGWGSGFLVFICLLLPYIAIRTSRAIGDGELPMPRRLFYWQTIFFQLLVYAMALVAAGTNGIRLQLVPRLIERSYVAIILLVLALLFLRLRWSSRSNDSKARLLRLLPQSPGELSPYILLCVVASIAEEVAYRGAAYRLVLQMGANMYVAVGALSLAFAIGHMVQGWRSVGVIFVFALAFHAVVIYCGGLLPAILAHFAYDLLAGLIVPRWK